MLHGGTVSLAKICPFCGITMCSRCTVNQREYLMCRACEYEIYTSFTRKLFDKFVIWVFKKQ